MFFPKGLQREVGGITTLLGAKESMSNQRA